MIFFFSKPLTSFFSAQIQHFHIHLEQIFFLAFIKNIRFAFFFHLKFVACIWISPLLQVSHILAISHSNRRLCLFYVSFVNFHRCCSIFVFVNSLLRPFVSLRLPYLFHFFSSLYCQHVVAVEWLFLETILYVLLCTKIKNGCFIARQPFAINGIFYQKFRQNERIQMMLESSIQSPTHEHPKTWVTDESSCESKQRIRKFNCFQTYGFWNFANILLVLDYTFCDEIGIRLKEKLIRIKNYTFK